MPAVLTKTFSSLGNTARHFAHCQMHQVFLCPFVGCATACKRPDYLTEHFNRCHSVLPLKGPSVVAVVIERCRRNIQPDYVRRRIKVVLARPECRGAFTSSVVMQNWRQKHTTPVTPITAIMTWKGAQQRLGEAATAFSSYTSSLPRKVCKQVAKKVKDTLAKANSSATMTSVAATTMRLSLQSQSVTNCTTSSEVHIDKRQDVSPLTEVSERRSSPSPKVKPKSNSSTSAVVVLEPVSPNRSVTSHAASNKERSMASKRVHFSPSPKRPQTGILEQVSLETTQSEPNSMTSMNLFNGPAFQSKHMRNSQARSPAVQLPTSFPQESTAMEGVSPESQALAVAGMYLLLHGQAVPEKESSALRQVMLHPQGQTWLDNGY